MIELGMHLQGHFWRDYKDESTSKYLRDLFDVLHKK